ncbi:hypothetical protein DVH05_003058 [Phytophthora capsici]|nr:hypothetical protein DVH05_003058 [Phytophthora capsici]
MSVFEATLPAPQDFTGGDAEDTDTSKRPVNDNGESTVNLCGETGNCETGYDSEKDPTSGDDEDEDEEENEGDDDDEDDSEAKDDDADDNKNYYGDDPEPDEADDDGRFADDRVSVFYSQNAKEQFYLFTVRNLDT